MENSWNWEQKKLISELLQGKELTKQLRHNLVTESSIETRDFLMNQILSTYENALLILKWSESLGKLTHSLAVTTTSLPQSPISVNGSPRSDDFERAHKDLQVGYKKRKVLPRWTEQVRIASENGLEGPLNDGYSWRKYGQKDILGAKHPRSYYRCTFRSAKNCWATKQVQRSDADRSVFDITYRGKHTCSSSQGNNNSVQAPSSPEKEEQKFTNHYNIHGQQQFEQSIQGIPNNFRFSTENFELKEKTEYPFSFSSSPNGFSALVLDNEAFLGSFCESFTSPATPEQKHNMISPFEMNSLEGSNKVHRSASNLTEILSANTSATNSPIPELDFCVDQAENEQKFSYDMSEFFS